MHRVQRNATAAGNRVASPIRSIVSPDCSVFVSSQSLGKMWITWSPDVSVLAPWFLLGWRPAELLMTNWDDSTFSLNSLLQIPCKKNFFSSPLESALALECAQTWVTIWVNKLDVSKKKSLPQTEFCCQMLQDFLSWNTTRLQVLLTGSNNRCYTCI